MKYEISIPSTTLIFEEEIHQPKQSYGSVTFWYDPAPDPAIFVLDLQDANKKLFFSEFFCLSHFKGTFTSFF